MLKKWQHFLLGLLSGSLITGLIALFFTNNVPINLRFQKQVESVKTLTQQHNSLQPGGSDLGFQTRLTPGINITSEIIGKIDINYASQDELITLPGIGDVRAKSIIAFREKYGYFSNIEELLYVPGVGKSLFLEIKDLVFVSVVKEQ